MKKRTLKEQVELYERIFDSVHHGIIITDPDGYVLHLNRPYSRFLNIDHESSIGKHCTEVVENTRMHIVARTGRAEINQIQMIRGKNIIVQRIPVKKEGQVIAVFGRVMFDDLRNVVKLAKQVDILESKVKIYEAELLHLRSAKYTFDSILGQSRQMLRLKDEALGATSNNFPVLISGESGTGKELFAHAIHQSSARNIYPFVRINCAAIPRELLESELFGYEKGAFTGAANKGKPGKFELAHRGTIFLDEIGDMPVEMQPKILRAIEDKEFERVGGTKVMRSDFRIISATNRNLEEMMHDGRFRSDLFYRLNVIPLQIPPLRERKSDISLLATHILMELTHEADLPPVRIEKEAVKALSEYRWPGNVRELTNVLERTLSRLQGDVIRFQDLPFYIHQNKSRAGAGEGGSLRAVQWEAEKQAVIDALEASRYNKTEAARSLGIHRTLLYRKIKKFNIPLKQEKDKRV